MTAGGHDDRETTVALGRISGVFGVNGWVKVFSYTEPRENVVSYREWWLEKAGRKRRFRVTDGRPQGRTIVAKLEEVDDRDEASAWVGADILVDRSSLPSLPNGEFYWADLVGLEVRDARGGTIGRLAQMLETGAHDVMCVECERGEEILIPFVFDETVIEVCPAEGYLVVDWEWR